MAVALAPLDESNLAALLDLAVTTSDPLEVMPPMSGPPGWTPERIEAFRKFYRERFGGLDNALETAAYAIVADGEIAGMIRMSLREPPDTVETGMWLGRPFRGKGIGAAALRALLLRAAEAGADTVIADTTPDNAAALGSLGSVGALFTSTPDKIYAVIPVHAHLSPGVQQSGHGVVG